MATSDPPKNFLRAFNEPRRCRPTPLPTRLNANQQRHPRGGGAGPPPPPPTTPHPAARGRGRAARARWAYTPPATKAPFSLARPKDPRRSVWTTNEDPKKLDRFYEKFLGASGPGMLPEELKWLAVTHKSFDQGRRGFNDRLAYFGGFRS